MRIVVFGTRDQDAMFGRDPDALVGVDIKASYAKFEEEVTRKLLADYPTATVEISERPADRCCDVLDDVDYPMDDELPFVEQIIHDVWEDWGWVVTEERKES